MMHPLARRLLLREDSNPVEHSQSIRLDGRSFLTAEIRLLSASSLTSLTVTIELSNDLENWFDSGLDAATLTTPPDTKQVFGVSGVATAVDASFARVCYTVAGSGGRALVATTLDVARA